MPTGDREFPRCWLCFLIKRRPSFITAPWLEASEAFLADYALVSRQHSRYEARLCDLQHMGDGLSHSVVPKMLAMKGRALATKTLFPIRNFSRCDELPPEDTLA